MYKREYVAIILAAGSGNRCFNICKPFFPINGRCIINYLLDTICLSSMFEEIVVVVPEDSLDMYRRLIEYKVIVVAGGDTRTASMLNGLSVVNSKCVMVHEGARPFVSVEHIENLKNMFISHGRLPTDSVEMAQIASGNGWVRCPLIGINYKLTVFEDLLLAERYFK